MYTLNSVTGRGHVKYRRRGSPFKRNRHVIIIFTIRVWSSELIAYESVYHYWPLSVKLLRVYNQTDKRL